MDKKALISAIFAVILISLTAGCAKSPSPDDRILVAVSDRNITLNDFKSKIAKMPPYYQKIIEKDKKRYLEEMIMEMLFYEEAVRKGFNKDKEVLDLLKEAKRKILIAKLIKAEVDDKVNITESEMREYYESHKADFKTPEMWRASHILVATEEEARDILASLASGARFEDIAKEKSMDATASRGGDIGYFRAGQLVPDFEKVCLKLNVGETSDVLHTQFGYHVIKLTDKKEPGSEDYEKVKAAIDNELRKTKRSELFSRLVSGLREKYGVRIEEDVFNSMEGREAPAK